MKDLKEIYSPVYGCTIFDDKNKYEDDDRKVFDYEMMSSVCKSLKIQQLKLLHRHIIDIADELYRFSDELDMSDKEERNCKISIIESLKELTNVAEYLTKYTLCNEHESYESSK
jgi:hypothetical protein